MPAKRTKAASTSSAPAAEAERIVKVEGRALVRFETLGAALLEAYAVSTSSSQRRLA